jgi:hypothetical protein
VLMAFDVVTADSGSVIGISSERIEWPAFFSTCVASLAKLNIEDPRRQKCSSRA